MTRVVSRRLRERKHPERRLGRHVQHDPRSRDYPVTARAAARIQAVSWARLGGPFDQGDLGSCTGNAMAGWLNTANATGRSGTLLSETDAVRLYSAATKLDPYPGEYPPTDTGSSGLAVCQAARAEGRISGYRHAFSLRAALTALQSGPVITGVPWLDQMDHPDASGRVHAAGAERGGHEFEVVSFEPAHTRARLLDGIVGAWNSWGLGWGLGGQFFFSARDWATLLEQDGDVTVPVA